jgi:hypothetical protein
MLLERLRRREDNIKTDLRAMCLRGWEVNGTGSLSGPMPGDCMSGTEPLVSTSKPL